MPPLGTGRRAGKGKGGKGGGTDEIAPHDLRNKLNGQGRGAQAGGRGGGGNYGNNLARGQYFAEMITFAGRADQFVMTQQTFVPASVYGHFSPSDFREGCVIRGRRIPSNDDKASAWRCVQVEAVSAAAEQQRQQQQQDKVRNNARHAGGGRSGSGQATGTSFSEMVTFAGRSDVFVIAGRDTYIPANLFVAWRPVHEGDRIQGTRVANSAGSSKWRATSVQNVTRAAAPAPSAHESWLESSGALLARIEREYASGAGRRAGSSGDPSHRGSVSCQEPSSTAWEVEVELEEERVHLPATASSTSSSATRHAVAKREAESLLRLALMELRALPPAQLKTHQRGLQSPPDPQAPSTSNKLVEVEAAFLY